MRIIPYHQELQGQGSMSEILLYGLIEVLSFKEGYCFASNQYLAENLDMAKGSIANLLARIAKKGWVLIEVDEQNHRTAIKPNLTITPLTKELTPPSLNNEPPLNSRINIYNKTILKEDNITNKLVIGDSPTKMSELVDEAVKKSYGNEEINYFFSLFARIFGYEMKQTQANRRAVYNFIRAKDKGPQWLEKIMILWYNSREDKYSPRISDFADLQSKQNALMEWGQRKSMNKKSEEYIL